MSVGADWLDEITGDRSDWVRVGPGRIETELRPGLPCRIVASEVGGLPVLYMAVGTNGAVHYMQTASLDRESGRPLPKAEALRNLRDVLEVVSIASMSEVRPKMVDWSREVA